MNEQDQLHQKILELTRKLDSIKIDKILERASAVVIDYGSDKVTAEIGAVKAQLSNMRSADLLMLYRRPFFESLRTPYARAIVAAACLQLADERKSKTNPIWQEMVDLAGDLNDQGDDDEE